jgi:hypothetical protein
MMTECSSRPALVWVLASAFFLSGFGCGATQRIALPTNEARARDATAWHIVSSPPPPPVESPRPEFEQTADATSTEAVVPYGSSADAAEASNGATAPDEVATLHEAADASPSPFPDPAGSRAQPSPVARAPTATATSWDELTDDDTTTKKKNRGTRSKRFHDGAYSRYGFGGGYQSATSKNGSTISGGGVSVDVWFGGTPAPGWAIGAMWSALLVADPDASISAADNNGVAVSGQARGLTIFSSLGPFVDFYPDPRTGLHFTAGLTYSSFSFTNDNGESSGSATGVGLFGGTGYEAWVSSEWSLGLLARLQWASLRDSSGTTTALAPVLLLGLTCH